MVAVLARLEEEYERRHGSCLVVFVNRRSRAEMFDALRERIDSSTARSSGVGLVETAETSEGRWRRSRG